MTFEDRVKTSFDKVKSEILELRKELISLKEELNELKYENMTKKAFERGLEEIKPNLAPEISTGNRGVSTLRQTDTQTFDTPSFPLDDKPSEDFDTSTHSSTDTSTHIRHTPEKLRHFDTSFDTSSTTKSGIKDLTNLMESLKSDLKKKFESLTKQEFFIFSVLFTVDKTQNQVTYQDLAVRTGLTPSSIRDYIQRIGQKGIPIIKERINNKLTVLKIPPELRNLATLDNLMRIRGINKDSNLNKFT